MSNYGTDKPDLRNPLIYDISEVFNRDDVKFEILKNYLNLDQK